MQKVLAEELLDGDAGTPAEIARSLGDLWWIHRHLGGTASWRRLWRRVLAERRGWPSGVLTLLDVGAGTGQVAAAHAWWLSARGRETWPVALDRRASHLIARNPGLRQCILPALAADGCRLPFADGAFDFVTCNLLLHHFHDHPADARASRLLREMQRVARRAVVINDLERSWWPYLAIRALSFRMGRLTRHDGPRSVRQAYTHQELKALAAVLAPGRSCVLRLPYFRLGLILWSQDAAV